jgi:hypothetical protein
MGILVGAEIYFTGGGILFVLPHNLHTQKNLAAGFYRAG